MGASHNRRVEMWKRGGGGGGQTSKQLTLASSFSSSLTTTSAKLHRSRQLSASKWRCFLSMRHLQVNTCCTSATVSGQHLLHVSSCCRSTFAAGQQLLQLNHVIGQASLLQVSSTPASLCAMSTACKHYLMKQAGRGTQDRLVCLTACMHIILVLASSTAVPHNCGLLLGEQCMQAVPQKSPAGRGRGGPTHNEPRRCP